jgi:hypothetical protein
MAEAGGGFVTRSFERMLKEASGKKHFNLQQALKAYLGTQRSFHSILFRRFFLLCLVLFLVQFQSGQYRACNDPCVDALHWMADCRQDAY